MGIGTHWVRTLLGLDPGPFRLRLVRTQNSRIYFLFLSKPFYILLQHDEVRQLQDTRLCVCIWMGHSLFITTRYNDALLLCCLYRHSQEFVRLKGPDKCLTFVTSLASKDFDARLAWVCNDYDRHAYWETQCMMGQSDNLSQYSIIVVCVFVCSHHQ